MESLSTDNTNAGTFFRVLNGATTVGQSTQAVTNTGDYLITTGTSSESEKMRITAAGSVGIGTTSPLGELHIVNASGAGQPVLELQQQNAGSNILQWRGSAGSYLGVISNDGNVGIGTTSPNNNTISAFDALTIGKTSTSSSALVFTNGSSTIWGFNYANASKYTLSSSTDLAFETGASWSEKMRITSGGTVQPGANGTQDLGTSSLRWATVFTSDLDMSNGIGDYTIVEGEEDLFLYNNKTNKVFKFVIQEVDPSTAPPKKVK
jgi:hypothetical protein